MPYGTIKVDNIVFTNSGVDQTIGVSGLVQSISGNLTATGTISGNIIRGTTVSGTTVTGGAGQFTTITGGVLSVTSGVFAPGTSGAPSISFSSDSNTGFWSPAGDTVAISTGGSERIRVDVNGDLGVGTTDPTSRLTVRADATSGPNTIIRVENRAASAGATTQNIKVEGIFDYNNGASDASAGAIVFGKEGTYTTATTNNDSYLAFETTTDNSSTEKLRINSTGQVVTTISGTAAAPALSVGNDLNTGIYSPGADQVAISTNGTGKLFVDASGNIGVGVTTPSVFSVGKAIEIGHAGNALFGATSSQFNLMQNVNYNTDFKYINTAAASYYQQLSGAHIWYTAVSGTAGTTATFSERLRITNTGLVGLGTSSPSATLHVATVGNPEILIGGTQTPILSFVGGAGSDPLIGYAVGALRFGTVSGAAGAGFTERMRIDTSGRVGINTTAPQSSARLHVYATGDYTDESAPFTVGDSTAGGMRLFFGINNTSNYGYIGSVESATAYRSLVLQPGGGNVGIGTTSPDTALTVSGSGAGIRVQPSNAANATIFLRHGSISTNSGLEADITGALGLYANGSERVRIDSSGRLLVGTSIARSNVYVGSSAYIPGVQFESVTNTYNNGLSLVNYSASGYAPVLTLGSSLSNTQGANALVTNGNDLGLINFVANDGTNFRSGAYITATVDATSGSGDIPTRLVFSTTADGASSPTERMRIDSAGRFMVGTTSDGGADGLTIYPTGSGAGSAAIGVWNKTNTSSEGAAQFRVGGSTIGSITYSNTAVAYNTTSDYRLKENVTPLTGAADRLNQLQVHRFNFIAAPDKSVDGFIAHEAQAVVPECVTGTKDEVDADGNPIYQGIDQSKLVPLLTAALQEAIGRIETLEAEVAALKGA